MMIRHLFIAWIMAISAIPLNGLDAKELTWKMMRGLNHVTGEMSEDINKIPNQLVSVAGFIVPLEMDEYADEVKEFLLVPDPLACIHVPPPPPNQMIHIIMNHKIPVNMDFRGVKIKGIITISNPREGLYSYTLDGLSAEEANIEYEDPIMEIINLEIGD